MNNINNRDGEQSNNLTQLPVSDKLKLKVIELCSGVGMQFRGLENTPCFEPELVATSEINKDAILSYAAIHCGMTQGMVDDYKFPHDEEMIQYLTDLNIGYEPEKDKPYNWNRCPKAKLKKYWLACKLSKNLGDVSRIEKLPEADLWFISTPCVDISVAGKLKGLNPDDNTRSSLVWQTIRLLKEAQKTNTLPKYMMLENVKNLVGKKFINDFKTFNELVEEFNYHSYWKVINAKNCGIPQNRERVFCFYIRTDIDTGYYHFPKPFDNGLRLKDILEKDVDEKYYINTDKAEKLIKQLIDTNAINFDKYEKECL